MHQHLLRLFSNTRSVLRISRTLGFPF